MNTREHSYSGCLHIFLSLHFISCPLLSSQCFWWVIFTNLLLPASSFSVLIKRVYLGERANDANSHIHLFHYNVQLTGGGAEWTDFRQDFRLLAIFTEIKACVDVCCSQTCTSVCVQHMLDRPVAMRGGRNLAERNLNSAVANVASQLVPYLCPVMTNIAKRSKKAQTFRRLNDDSILFPVWLIHWTHCGTNFHWRHHDRQTCKTSTSCCGFSCRHPNSCRDQVTPGIQIQMQTPRPLPTSLFFLDASVLATGCRESPVCEWMCVCVFSEALHHSFPSLCPTERDRSTTQ